MSKSKGNALTPQHLITTYGADGVRYWAARAGLGVDATFDEPQMKVGRRLATKLLNASRLITSLEDADDDAVAEPLDLQMLACLKETITEASRRLERYEHAHALNTIERSFWDFCDNYLELAKAPAYGELGRERQRSAHTALRAALSIYQRLLAPYLPYVCEETWSWRQPGSIHRADRPTTEQLPSLRAEGLGVATTALAAVRKTKSDARRKLRTPITRAVISDAPERLAALREVLDDFRAAANISELRLREAREFSLQAELSDT